jgi:hypothetical protein
LGDGLLAQKMSLQEKYREGLYDPKHKPRLSYARNYFLQFTLKRSIDFTELTEFYREWRDYVEYLVLQEQTKNLKIQGEIDKETIAVKCAKRGNDVYWGRVWERLKPITNLKEHTLFDTHSNIKRSNVLFMTLTYDVKRSTIQEAWETVGKEFNKWINNIRKKFGRISYLRCWEASRKGYPHIHVLLVFHDHPFRIVFSQLKKGRRVYRIAEKEAFEKSYHSFVDVQAVRKLREGIKYVLKYLSKNKYMVKSQTLTLALCWLFKKRSFALSGDFHETVYTVLNIRFRFVQADLFGNKVISRVEWVLIGIYSAELLGVDPSVWSHRINLDDFDVCWDENERLAELIRKEEKIVNEKLI